MGGKVQKQIRKKYKKTLEKYASDETRNLIRNLSLKAKKLRMWLYILIPAALVVGFLIGVLV